MIGLLLACFLFLPTILVIALSLFGVMMGCMLVSMADSRRERAVARAMILQVFIVPPAVFYGYTWAIFTF